jgi:uncharacterized protein YeaO (DUF488 family)
MIRFKSIHQLGEMSSGKCFLIDRTWPEGVRRAIPRKEKSGGKLASPRCDGWLKELAPSRELEKWFRHAPDKENEFRRRYMMELEKKQAVWLPVVRLAADGEEVVLVYGEKRPDLLLISVLGEFLTRKVSLKDFPVSEHKKELHLASQGARPSFSSWKRRHRRKTASPKGALHGGRAREVAGDRRVR